jgi:hypothetical protein
LATGYAHNIGLTRIPPLIFGKEKFIGEPNDAIEAMYAKDPTVLKAMERLHTPEEQRALLGCYYLASVWVHFLHIYMVLSNSMMYLINL